MLDPKLLRNQTAAVFKALALRGKDYDIDNYLVLEQQRKELQVEAESTQAELKVCSRQIAQLKTTGAELKPALQKADKLKLQLGELQKKLSALQTKLNTFLLGLPNIPDTSVPQGSDERDNREVRRWQQPPRFDFEPLDHVDLATTRGWLDMEAAATIAGSRFMVLHRELARLHRALIDYMVDLHVQQHGYNEIYVPYIVNAKALLGTGQLPKFEHDLFKLHGDSNFYLIPTAEVPVTNLYQNTILEAAQLPLHYVCHTPCFRSEAGAYGKDTHGLMRQHQFEKVELVHITTAEDSWASLEILLSHAETVLQNLELHYRVVELCSGDLGFAAAKTYDIEVWVPSENRYREISSCSNMLDFQARRMKTRMRNTTNKIEYVHTLNGSGLAIGRSLLALLENHQRADGSIAIPAALQPYMGGKTTIGVE